MSRKKKDGRSLGNHRVYKTEKQRVKAKSTQVAASQRKTTKAYGIRLSYTNHEDVINFLDSLDNKQEVIVAALRDYIKKQGE